jgi:hypothetical protein
VETPRHQPGATWPSPIPLRPGRKIRAHAKELVGLRPIFVQKAAEDLEDLPLFRLIALYPLAE